MHESVPFHRRHHGESRLECWRRREFFCAAYRCWTLLLETYKGKFTKKIMLEYRSSSLTIKQKRERVIQKKKKVLYRGRLFVYHL